MQVVAVTDPMELGFARQAMVGIRVTGAIEPVADALAALDEVDYVVVTAGSYDVLAEVVAESDEHLLEMHQRPDPRPSTACCRPRRSCTSSCASRPTRGESAERCRRRYGGLSLWHETTADRLDAAACRCDGDVDADVAIVGAGFTGLWTAYYLAEADPALRIVVLEAEVAGFGASGRNGGWCSALFPTSLALEAHGRGAAEHSDATRSDEVGRSPTRASTATSPRAAPSSLARSQRPSSSRGARAESRRPACSPPTRPAERLRATRTLGATYTPDCAAIHPARLVRGLADGGDRRGVDDPRADPGALRSSRASCGHRRGSVRAPYVVRATEGYTPRLPGLARAWRRSTR